MRQQHSFFTGGVFSQNRYLNRARFFFNFQPGGHGFFPGLHHREIPLQFSKTKLLRIKGRGLTGNPAFLGQCRRRYLRALRFQRAQNIITPLRARQIKRPELSVQLQGVQQFPAIILPIAQTADRQLIPFAVLPRR